MTQPERVTVTVSEHHGDRPMQQQASGPPDVIAAWLRALANRYDPPRPALRGTDDHAGPAAGLRMERDTTDQPRGTRNRPGFAPPKLETP